MDVLIKSRYILVYMFKKSFYLINSHVFLLVTFLAKFQNIQNIQKILKDYWFLTFFFFFLIIGIFWLSFFVSSATYQNLLPLPNHNSHLYILIQFLKMNVRQLLFFIREAKREMGMTQKLSSKKLKVLLTKIFSSLNKSKFFNQQI